MKKLFWKWYAELSFLYSMYITIPVLSKLYVVENVQYVYINDLVPSV